MHSLTLDAHEPATTERHGAATDDLLLAKAFLQASGTFDAEVVAVNERMLMSTRGSTALVGGMDQAALWHWAKSRRAGGPALLHLDVRRPIRAVCMPVEGSQSLAGMILRLEPIAPADAGSANDRAELFHSVIPGDSRHASELRTEFGFASDNEADVLIIGEPGTGKATIARHLLCLDADSGEITEIDAAQTPLSDVGQLLSSALKRGHVLMTHVDHLIGSARSEVWAILRQPHPGRRVVATASDAGVDDGIGRAFVRRVNLPPLRERLEDLPAIASQVLHRRVASRAKRLDPGVRRQLWSYAWPGNITELTKVLDEAANLAPTSVIDESCVRLPASIGGGLGARRRSLVEAAEVDSLLDALRRCGGNKVAAADMLDISRSTLYRKVRALGL